jgi:hypothetical protein
MSPELSDKTHRIYEAALLKLKKHFNAQDLSFLSDASGVIQYIESLDCSDNTRKIYYITLRRTLKEWPDKTDAVKQAEQQYKEKMDTYNRRAYEKMETQAMDDREKALWLDWADVLKTREKAYDTASDLLTYQDYVILCLYTFLPPARVDYAPLHVVEQEDQKPEGNLLVVGPRSMEFVMREYKTASKYGTRHIAISKPLEKVLRNWLELNPSGWLLCSQDGTPMTETQLSARIRTIFQRLVGKPVGVNILRHSFVSFLRKGEPSLKRQKEVANAMGHSIGMSQIYRRIQ